MCLFAYVLNLALLIVFTAGCKIRRTTAETSTTQELSQGETTPLSDTSVHIRLTGLEALAIYEFLSLIAVAEGEGFGSTLSKTGPAIRCLWNATSPAYQARCLMVIDSKGQIRAGDMDKTLPQTVTSSFQFLSSPYVNYRSVNIGGSAAEAIFKTMRDAPQFVDNANGSPGKVRRGRQIGCSERQWPATVGLSYNCDFWISKIGDEVY